MVKVEMSAPGNTWHGSLDQFLGQFKSAVSGKGTAGEYTVCFLDEGNNSKVALKAVPSATFANPNQVTQFNCELTSYTTTDFALTKSFPADALLNPRGEYPPLYREVSPTLVEAVKILQSAI